MEPLKIIIADNYPVFRAGMEFSIKKINSFYQVFQASSGTDVLELAKSNSVDIVFIEIKMQGMDGIETTYKLKEINPEIKVIAVSEINEKYDVLKMFKAGANGYLLKSASIEKIELAIKKIIEGGNYYTEDSRCFFSGAIFQKRQLKMDKMLREELSEREKEILILICLQLSTREISERMGLSEKTVEIHRANIIKKTHSKNMIGTVLYAIEKGFINHPAMVS